MARTVSNEKIRCNKIHIFPMQRISNFLNVSDIFLCESMSDTCKNEVSLRYLNFDLHIRFTGYFFFSSSSFFRSMWYMKYKGNRNFLLLDCECLCNFVTCEMSTNVHYRTNIDESHCTFYEKSFKSLET